jgi:hypothetical protein
MTRPPSGAPPENGAAQGPPASEPEDNSDQGWTADREEEPSHPLPWLANVEPHEYEFMRRRLARERHWRVAFLDHLYRQARRQAGRR